jgi:antitoxin component YwqK of YwqJK toxin-antitoxin module
VKRLAVLLAALVWAPPSPAQHPSDPGAAALAPADTEGMVKKYYPSGELMSAFSTWDGKLDGPAYDYYKTGQVMYLRDQLHGDCRAYTLDGKLTTKWSYKRGKLHGKTVEYHRNGKTKAVITYRQGAKVAQKTYDEREKLLKKETFAPAAGGAAEPAAAEEGDPPEKDGLWTP